jgi:hypothetical protein
MKLPRFDRPARHRAAASGFRVLALGLIWSAVHQYGAHIEKPNVAIAYLGCIVLAIMLVGVAAVHDLVAATLRPKFWFTSLRAGDREVVHGGAE